MSLSIQLYSIIYSFFWGIILYYLLYLLDYILFKKHFLFQLFVSLFFLMLLSIIYFIGILFINNGWLHLYFFFSILLGYCLVFFLHFTFVNKKK